MPRPLSQLPPYTLHYPPDDDADAVSLARSISKDSLASNITSITPKHLLRSGPQRSQHRLSGQSLLSHMHIEDEEEELEEEELVAVINPSSYARSRLASDIEQDELDIPNVTASSKLPKTHCSPYDEMDRFTAEHPADKYCLEPLMPAIPKAAKEKSISLNKEEESGENHHRAAAAAAARKVATNFPTTPQRKAAVAAQSNINTLTPSQLVEPSSVRPPVEGSVGQSEKIEPQGFFLHLSGESECHSTFPLDAGQDSDSDIADLDEDEEEEEMSKEEEKNERKKYFKDGELCDIAEGESAKLREDLKVSEREDKEDCSRQSSPCLSTASWPSSCSASASSSIKMTSFAERKLLKLGLRDGFSSTSSSQKTTPDGSEVVTCPPWQLRSDCTSSWMGKEPVSVLGKNVTVGSSVVPSELLQLHMQLEEQRRAIEYQKKKLETLSARQRLKLGKAAFLNIVKSGGKSDTLPLPLKHSESAEFSDKGKVKTPFCKDDSCLDALKVQAKTEQTEGGGTGSDNRLSSGAEPDRNECSHSIDLLNEAISSIQQQMMQLSLQQDLLMKHVVSPPEQVESGPSATPNATQPAPSTSDPRCFAVHFVDLGDSSTPVRRPPKLSSGQRRKTEQKQSDDSSKTPTGKSNTLSDQKTENVVESSKMEKIIQRKATFRVHSDISTHHGPEQHLDPVSGAPVHESASQTAELEENQVANSGNEAVAGDENTRLKGQLIEVDLSELKDLEEGSADVADPPMDSEPKNVLGFFFKVKFCFVTRDCPHMC